MKEIINNIKKRPEPVRRQIILAISIVLTALIAIFWIGVMSYNFSTDDRKLSDDLKPFTDFGNTLSNIIK